MKIICIAHNYAEHAREMAGPIASEPVFFMKPDTALLEGNKPFILPDFSEEVHYEAELVIKISRGGKNINEKVAHKHYQEISIGIDFTARDIQRACKKKGWPWEKAKAFDHSAATGDFLPKRGFQDINSINFHLDINGTTVQRGNSKDMLFSFDFIIAYISRYITLITGDLIFTGTPEGVGRISANDKLQGYVGEVMLLETIAR